MKTAEEWRKYFKVWAEEWASDREVKAIQLDAMQEGMRRAVNKLNEACYEGTVVFSEAKQAILSAAEKLTDKDL